MPVRWCVHLERVHERACCSVESVPESRFGRHGVSAYFGLAVTKNVTSVIVTTRAPSSLLREFIQVSLHRRLLLGLTLYTIPGCKTHVTLVSMPKKHQHRRQHRTTQTPIQGSHNDTDYDFFDDYTELSDLPRGAYELGSVHVAVHTLDAEFDLLGPAAVSTSEAASYSPSLPAELWREIFLLITEPDDRTTTLRLSSVCSYWRSIVMEESRLFSFANWDDWPSWLLKDWCSRSHGHPLTIILSPSALRRLCTRRHSVQTDIGVVLFSMRSAWTFLHLDLSECVEPHELRKINEFLVAASPLNHLLSLSVVPGSSVPSRRHWFDILKMEPFRAPRLFSLMLLVQQTTIGGVAQLSIPSLRCLGVCGDVGSVRLDQFFASAYFPNLTMLMLHNNALTFAVNESLLMSMVRRVSFGTTCIHNEVGYRRAVPLL